MRPIMKIWPWEILNLEFDPDEDTSDETQEDEIEYEEKIGMGILN